ncbi:MAG: hypothetical protein M1819_004251 [Sarea resinae]|nr:MAG: hypothetical protein M1819_004251 [Sarea resinae]
MLPVTPLFFLLFLLLGCHHVSAHSHASHSHGADPLADPAPGPMEEDVAELERKWVFEWGFSGISTFAHLPYVKCLTHPDEHFDIGIIGAPFDTAVSYRPGARFGPRAIRAASARQTTFRGYNPRARLNPYTSWARILDCGDIPVTPFDNALALRQMTEAFTTLLSRPAHSSPSTTQLPPKLLTLGGDHSLALPALRALYAVHAQPLTVLHFDAHLDTWSPDAYPSYWTTPGSQSDFTHGSMFQLAWRESLLANGSSVHAGLRTRLSGSDTHDWDDDDAQGWTRISADDLDDLGGPDAVARSILAHIGTVRPVYLSVDIDVLDPGFAPGTGTPEPGGWSTRELIRVLRGVEGLNVVGADIVEVSPAFDARGETTALAAAQVGYEILSSLVRRGLQDREENESGVEMEKQDADGGRDRDEL